MKAEIAKQWVKALRSKRYKQGKQALKIKTKAGVTRHCCLGVLCELYQKAHPDKKLTTKQRKTIKGEERPAGATVFGFESDDIHEETQLPARVQRWAGIDSDDGWLGYKIDSTLYADYPALTDMNDNGRSFAQIADVIEEHFKDL